MTWQRSGQIWKYWNGMKTFSEIGARLMINKHEIRAEGSGVLNLIAEFMAELVV